MKPLLKLTASFEINTTKQLDYIYNLSSYSINKYNFKNKKKEICFKDLKHPSYICLSNKEDQIACISTSGQIAIYDINKNNLILFDKEEKNETCNIYYTPDDKFLLIGD